MKTLYEKAKLGNIIASNRFIRSATWENMASEEGHMTNELYELYEELAKGEVGIIITGYANIVKEEKPNAGMMGMYNDSFIDEYRKLTNIVHAHGSKIIMQLAYGGTKTTYNVEDRIIFAPSEVPDLTTNVKGKPMSREDIEYIIEAFAEAGRRAKESGFDGVEVHGAHTYLINQFLSPYYNKRTDEYGGCLENRMRFLLEIYQRIREKVGTSFPILVKLTATEFFDGGLTFQETIQICKELERIGCDGIELSGNIHGKAKSMVGKIFDGHELVSEGYFIEYAKIISNETNIPIITVGGFRDITIIERILTETNIDFFALSRPLLTEPHLIKRWKTGDRTPAKCIRCSKCRTPEGNYCVTFNKVN
ncbi:NADH:flavin oxidoreductase [Clostridium swellfunianum]|uniref:NADH:flavin oxidoreductase n=1 Tax=Clostridium swellfunianum TaxID=1367462 RepID=UPI0020305CEB|nr:NADH:flavin oxidoreductase [Clostridium swellfunianum]MCM0647149.1 NADH:flavin oxidoreductase [Clostridium swellfunianum]